MVEEGRIDSDENLQKLLNDPSEVVIYGAGHYGHVLESYSKKYLHFDRFRFAVSSLVYMRYPRDSRVDILDHYERDCMLVIAVSEQHHQELIEHALDLGFKKISVILNEYVRYMEALLNEERLKVKDTLGFEVHITEHCNLNCRGCYHFSPLAGEEYLDIKEYIEDLKRIRELCGDKVEHITLLGGEPLLHPDIVKFIEKTREIYRNTRLEILTNGLLLQNMDRKFWDACWKNRVSLCCTKYPIAVDYDHLEEIARDFGLTINYHNDVGAGEKTLIKYPFDICGTQNANESFGKCTRSNLCTTLKHGRLYPCPMAAHAHLAKEYFGLDLKLSAKDYIDIYEASDMGELMTFLIRPIEFCKYCNLSRRPVQMKWGISEKKYDEWF